METKIYKITGWLDLRGYAERIREIEVTETDKSFLGDGSRISKDKLLTINTIYHENHASMRYYTYCRDGDQQKSLEMIKQHIVGKITTYKSEIDALMESVR